MNESVAQAAENAFTHPDTLKPADRCDRCGSAAYVRVYVHLPSNEYPDGTDVILCGHHYSKHEEVVVAAGYVVSDERWKLA